MPALDGCFEMEWVAWPEMAVCYLARKYHQVSPYRHLHLNLEVPRLLK